MCRPGGRGTAAEVGAIARHASVLLKTGSPNAPLVQNALGALADHRPSAWIREHAARAAEAADEHMRQSCPGCLDAGRDDRRRASPTGALTGGRADRRAGSGARRQPDGSGRLPFGGACWARAAC